MNSLKSKIEKLEGEAGKLKTNSAWRLKYAKDKVKVARTVERALGLKPKPEKEIIAAEKRYLGAFRTEADFLEHLKKITPFLKEIDENIKRKASR